MEPAKKKRVVEIIDQHDGLITACVLALESEFSILQKNIQSIRVCYEVTILNPSQIGMGIPTKYQLTLIMDGKELASNMQMQDATYQVDKYHSNPPNKT